MRTQTDELVFRTIVDYVFGSGDRGVTPVGHKSDGRPIECRLSFYPGSAGWDITTGQPSSPDLPSTAYQGRDAVRFQASTLVKSRCYTDGDRKLDCVTCHDPHQDAETRLAWYESRCLQCHSPRNAPGRNDAEATASRSAPCPVQPTGGCIDCHMPSTHANLAHVAFTDHYIRVHHPTAPSAK